MARERSAAAHPAVQREHRAGERATLAARIEHGREGAGGWRPLAVGPGEAHVGEPVPAGGRVLATIVHLSDIHICDAESPARLEYLDRHADAGEPYADIFEEIGTYRPQEILTAHVALAMVQTVNALTTGPVAGRPIDTVLVTGDVVDNAQANELGTYAAVLGGGMVSPASGGAASSWVGSATAGFWSERFWHPEGAPAGHGQDRLVEHFGYPQLGGLSESARQGLTSPGLSLPWLTVHGNHDALLQGTVAATSATRSLAVGARRVIDLAPTQTPYAALEATPAVGPARYVDEPGSPTVEIAPDDRRRLIEPGELASVLAALPGDHGFSAGQPVNYWARDVGGVRVLAIDTVNPHGGWEGSLDTAQLEWLRGQIAAADRPVVITSHHPSWTLRNPYAPDGAPRRVLAEELMHVLLAAPQVVLWIAGHVHGNTVRLHPSRYGGLLEVTTASLIDWPQQGRLIEIVEDPDGGVVVAMTLVDHSGWWPGIPASSTDLDALLGDALALAGLSRELAGNDYRARAHPIGLAWMAGQPAARNAVWRVPRTGLGRAVT